jgi:hypothetical protein
MCPRWCLAVGVVVVVTPAGAASIDVRCPKLAESSKSELEARGQLLLSSARMSSASLGIECEPGKMWLVWVDGSRLQIDTSSGVVEGTLDAIEDRILMGRYPREQIAPAPPPAAPDRRPVADEEFRKLSDLSDESRTKASSVAPTSPDVPKAPLRTGLEGGVAVSTITELWDGSVGVGPRLEVGVRVGGQFALVLAEGARFGLGSTSAQTLAFDMQWGVAYGAPYASRSGLGVVLLGGVERVAATAVGVTSSGWFAWSATGSLGVRGSFALGPVSVWVGPEAILRSVAIETADPTISRIPRLSGMLSLGCHFPAFNGSAQREDVGPPVYAARR